MLPGALRDELLQPGPEARDRRVRHDGQLVAAGQGERAERGAEGNPGVGQGIGRGAPGEHPEGAAEERVEVDPEERSGHETDVGEGGVAATDVLRVEEDAPQLVVVGDRLQAPARVGDRDHELAGRFAALPGGPECVVDPLPGLRLEGQRLGRGAGLAGHDHERGERVEAGIGSPDGRRIRRVEDADGQPLRVRSEGGDEDVRGEAAATHPGHDRRAEARLADPLPERLEPGDAVGEVAGGVEPAEPVPDPRLHRRVVGPDRRVAFEEPLRPGLLVGSPERGCHRLGQGRVEDPGVDDVRREGRERLCHRLPPAPCSLRRLAVRRGAGGPDAGSPRRARHAPRPRACLVILSASLPPFGGFVRGTPLRDERRRGAPLRSGPPDALCPRRAGRPVPASRRATAPSRAPMGQMALCRRGSPGLTCPLSYFLSDRNNGPPPRRDARGQRIPRPRLHPRTGTHDQAGNRARPRASRRRRSAGSSGVCCAPSSSWRAAALPRPAGVGRS